MRNLKLFVTYDSKAKSYCNPFCMATPEEAIRGFTDVANDPSTQFGKYPADFTLFEIGDYDVATGSVVTHDAKINLGTALDYKNNSMGLPADLESKVLPILKQPVLAKKAKTKKK